MSISSSISRFAVYLKRNGLVATAGRISLGVRRTLFANRMVIFYCDIPSQQCCSTDLPGFLKVERHQRVTDLNAQDLQEITSFWNPKLARRNLEERFRLGASLWLIRFQSQLAGYGWTLQGRTVEPHYFPLGERDVQFLDFHVFPKFRGRAIDWVLMTEILHRLAEDGMARAFGEAAEWNKASLSSFAMARFLRLGAAKKFVLFGRTFVWWDHQGVEERLDSKKVSLAAARRNRPGVPGLG